MISRYWRQVCAVILVVIFGTWFFVRVHHSPASRTVPGVHVPQNRTPKAPTPPPAAPLPEIELAGKYVGVALPGGAPGLPSFERATGTRAQINEVFVNWGQPYPVAEVKEAWMRGAATLISWQPDSMSLRRIAAGNADADLKRFAGQLKAVGLPVMLDFAHEMNGDWQPWGTRFASAADFVAAWRHVHDLVEGQGVHNALWVWSPNVVNPVPGVALAPYWPGDRYVDLAGMVGYWTGQLGEDSWETLIGPTERQIQAFTSDPIIITETGAQQGSRKAAWVTAMLKGFKKDPNVVALIYFDFGTSQNKRADWTLESDPAALAAWRKGLAGWPVPRSLT